MINPSLLKNKRDIQILNIGLQYRLLKKKDLLGMEFIDHKRKGIVVNYKTIKLSKSFGKTILMLEIGFYDKSSLLVEFNYLLNNTKQRLIISKDTIKKIKFKYKKLYSKKRHKTKTTNPVKLPPIIDKSSSKTIREIVLEREIKNLVHFTSLQNLKSILKLGLLSVNDLKNKNIEFTKNDPYRLDNYEEAICLSITFTNYKTFYYHRSKYDDREWVVLVLDSSVLWEKDCLFINGNAASSKNNISRKSKNNHLNNIKDFRSLFSEKKGYDRDSTPLNMTTDPQAEVLVFNRIEKRYIREVHYNNCGFDHDIQKSSKNINLIDKSKKYYDSRKYYIKSKNNIKSNIFDLWS
jgi:hypothetical protein